MRVERSLVCYSKFLYNFYLQYRYFVAATKSLKTKCCKEIQYGDKLKHFHAITTNSAFCSFWMKNIGVSIIRINLKL